MVSRTAQYVALYRALEADETARPPLFVDRFARRFLPRSLDLAVTAARARVDHGADDYRRRYLGPGPQPCYAFYRLAIADVAAGRA